MAQTVLITLTTAGLDTGPFNLYSDADSYVTPFETGVSKAALVSGYTSTVVPDAATIIRVDSTGVCTNFIDLSITVVPPTTTTTTTLPPPEVVEIDACANVQADSSGNVVAYAYSSVPVSTNVTVDLTWTASDLSMISGIVTILAGETCGTITLTGADPNEGGAGLEIIAIAPGSFGSQTYVEGVETLSASCTTCPIP